MKGLIGRRVSLVLGVAGLAGLACVEDVTSPAACPDYCPGGQVVTIESLLPDAVVRDTSFGHYILPYEAGVMLAATLPTLDSRPIFETLPIATRLPVFSGDSTSGAIVIDSARLTFTWLRRDAATRNVRLELYRLPLGIDTTSTLAGLAGSFGTPLRVVNLDSLLSLPGLRDSVTGDSILSRDSLRRTIVVSLKFDSAQAPYTLADSGKVALGIRVRADANATLALSALESGAGPTITWFNRLDSVGTWVTRPAQGRGLRFDSFVSDQSAPVIDSDLTVGGIPATRALLHFALPRSIRDSVQIIRATLLLPQAGPPPVVTGDSVLVQVNHVAADLGAKSPMAFDSIAPRSRLFVPNGSDTIRVEVTSLLRFWQADTTSVTAAYLRLIALDRRDSLLVDGTEGASFTTLRLSSSKTTAFRPTLRLTYVPRIKFGVP